MRRLPYALLASLAACSTPGSPTKVEAPVTRAEPPPAPETDAPYRALLAPWPGPHGGLPPFDAAKPEHFEPAIEAGAEQLMAEIRAIADDPAPPTFDNTLVAMERAGEPLSRATTIFSVMASSRNTPEIQELTKKIWPRLTAIYDEINFDPKLFARVKAVYDTRADRELSPEQLRLVEDTYEDFVRRGANLDAAGKERLGEINQTLSKHFNEFSNRVLADEDTWVTLESKADLAGLPASLVSSYAAAAKDRDLDGWIVVNTRSAVDPFLTFSDRRDLRQKVWRRFVMRGDNGDDHDTNELIVKVVKLRAERAKLLGYDSHAHWRMAETMAKDPERAEALMMRVWPAAVERVEQEVADMAKLARKETGKKAFEIEPWDYRYYMEKVRKQRYALDQSEFKQYFELNNMIRASYHMAEKLYGYAFEEVTGEHPVFHEDVRIFHVTNAADGSHVGYLYRDDFARQYKRSGAWQSTYRRQHKLDGQVDAIVSNNNNFTEGAPGEPVLISLDDAETLFHEFGHALHALTNDVTYPSLGGTPRDFVEFPSQVHENWVLTREILDQYARHYETGEAMPQALVDKMRAAATFNQGFATVEYLAAAIVDMRLHTDPEGEVDPAAFEKSVLADIGMPEQIVLRHRMPHFMHLFASDAYSAGYYSYLWSDVMAADAWKAFEEAGDPWHPATAAKFMQVILATGNAIDRAEAYRQFRGRDPEVEALLENRGLK